MSQRPKFPTRTILLRTEQQREQALALLKHVPLDDKKPLELLIHEQPKKRSLDQNSYYWMRLGEAAEQCYLEGRAYTSDVWHEYCRRNVMPEEITTKDGERRSKWIEVPDGTTTVISTTQLEKGCFAEYCTMIEAFFGNLGCRFSANPNERNNHA